MRSAGDSVAIALEVELYAITGANVLQPTLGCGVLHVERPSDVLCHFCHAYKKS